MSLLLSADLSEGSREAECVVWSVFSTSPFILYFDPACLRGNWEEGEEEREERESEKGR